MACCAAVAALLLAVPPSAAKAGTPQANLNYVALGDSYSSGEGNPPFEAGTDTNKDYCHRSDAAYPVALATVMLTAPLEFYACSGATTAQMESNYSNEGPQVNRVGPSVNLITLTAGGDDAKFPSVLTRCIIQTLAADFLSVLTGQADPVGLWLGVSGSPSCANSPIYTSAVNQQILNIRTPVEKLYQKLQARTDAKNSNDTSIIAADYPLIFPTTLADQICFQLSPYLTADDQNWLNSEANVLDTTLIKAARDVGVNMIDVRPLFAGHAICGNSGAWINGLSKASGILNGVAGSFHPNIEGQLGYATAFEDYISNPMNITTPQLVI